MTNKKNAIVLLSGGLDSATVLAIAQSQGFSCKALSFSYGQRHSAELNAATKIAACSNIDDHKIFDIDLSVFKGSALTDQNIDVPYAQPESKEIPATYVPARNTVFLSIALAWAEVLEVNDIFIGVNAVDYSGYPDCREEYIKSFESMANLATKAGVEGNVITIHTPLIELSKAGIITLGSKLGVDYALTVSCYSASKNGEACGNCDACHYRRQGFIEAGIADPTLYI